MVAWDLLEKPEAQITAGVSEISPEMRDRFYEEDSRNGLNFVGRVLLVPLGLLLLWAVFGIGAILLQFMQSH